MRLRDEGGAIALGRVLTLVVIARESDVETSIEAANDASREHPCRVIVVAPSGRSATPHLDAQLRGGGAAAAAEGSDAGVSRGDSPADTACTMDYVPATSVVAVPDDVDTSADVSVVLGDRGTVVVPPPAEGAAGEFAWTAG